MIAAFQSRLTRFLKMQPLALMSWSEASGRLPARNHCIPVPAAPRVWGRQKFPAIVPMIFVLLLCGK